MPSILVVDDDQTVQRMLVDLLKGQGYEVRTCRDGRQVLPELRRQQADLVVLDVLIPHMNGFVLIERMRADPELAEMPVVMVSGIYRSRNHRDEMTTRHKVVEYLDKPLDIGRLLGVVGQTIGPGDPALAAANTPAAPRDELADELGMELGDDTFRVIDGQAGEEPVPLSKPKSWHDVTLGPPRVPVQDETPDEGSARRQADERMFQESIREEKQHVESEARQSFKTSAFVLQGSLRKTPVAAVLGRIWHVRASGGLLVRSGKIKKIVYIRRGNPVSVKSNKVSECLGRILLRERLIGPDECKRSLEVMKASKKLQGEVLVGMGSLTKNNLAFALELQLETKLYDMFTWDSGEYRFNSALDVPPSENGLPWTGPALVTEGIRRTFDETRLRSQMLEVLDVPLELRNADLDLASSGFSGVEVEAIEAVVSPRTTRELLDAMPLDPPDALRVIYTLITLEILTPAT